MPHPFSKKLNLYLWQAFSLAVSITVFSLILANRSPNFLRPLSVALRTGFGFIIPMTAAALYLAFRIPKNRGGDLIGMAVALSLFAMPLAGLWASGQSQSTVLSGLIQISDASDYYIDALKLIGGQNFSDFSAHRPLSPGLLAVLLSLTGRNLMVALAVLAAITGLACYFATREIQQTHGAEVAVFILMILFLFYRAHSGITMSEHLGVTLGALGFGLLWKGATNSDAKIIWLGLLTTTLALNARAGAFFMLPLLVLWAGWLFRKQGKVFSWAALFISASAIILGFALNLTFTRLVAAPSGVPFANFSYTLYGLASGGKSWAYVFEAHPEVLKLQEPEQSKRIYQLAFELIREKPWQTAQGAFFNWKMLFSDSWYNVFAYVGGENAKIMVAARWILYALSLLGIVAWLRNKKDPVLSLVMVAAFGTFISVPFVPPTDAYRMRPYAASIIVIGALPAMGLFFILKWKNNFFNVAPAEPFHPNANAANAVVLILITLIGPVIVRSSGAPPILSPSASCATGFDSILVRLDKDSSINIRKQKEAFLDWAPNYHFGNFKSNAHSLADGRLIAWAETLEAPKTLFLTLDYRNNQKALAVVDSALLPNATSYAQMCGTWETDPNLRGYRIFYAEEIQTALSK